MRRRLTPTSWPTPPGWQALAELAQSHAADLFSPGFDMERGAQEEFAALTDYFHDFRDCSDLYSEVQKLEVHDEFQAMIDRLAELGVTLRYASRRMAFGGGASPDAKPVAASVLYLIAYEAGKEPEEFSTRRQVSLG